MFGHYFPMSYQGGEYFSIGFSAGIRRVKYNDIQTSELLVMEAKGLTDNALESVTCWCGRQLLFRDG